MPKGFYPKLSLAAPRQSTTIQTPRCGSCGLFRGCKSPKMAVAGQGRKGILVVGEAPGQSEDEQGKPFVGKTGRHLQEVLTRASIDLFRDCWVTNAARCFVGTTRVQSPSGIRKIYRRTYTGEIVRVTTVDGRVLTGTPNHPILTPDGWVALGLIKEGDNLVCCTVSKGSGVSNADVDDPPPRFYEVFESSLKFGNLKGMVGCGVDFHGDGEDGQIDVVNTDRLLGDGQKSPVNQHVGHLFFKSAYTPLSDFSYVSQTNLLPTNFFPRRLTAPRRLVGSVGQGHSAFGTGFVQTDDHRLTSATKFHTSPVENKFESVVGNAEGVRQRLKSLPGKVSLDRVVKIERQAGNQPFDGDDASDWSSHVYNLETDDGYYIADGIVVSNCRPPGNVLPDKAVDHCRPYLLRAIEELQPTVILLLGKHAIRSCLEPLGRDDVSGDGVVKKWAGWRIPCQKWNCWVCPTYHPSHVLRSLDEKRGTGQVIADDFARHVRQAVKLESKPWKEVPDYQSEVQILMDGATAVIHSFISRRCPVAFDYETNMLKPDHRDSRIVCCSVSDGTTTIAFPWVGEAKKTMTLLLAAPVVPKWGWNVRFETRWTLAQLGVWVRGWAWDGMTAAHALDSRPGVTGLKFQAFARLGVPDYSSHVEPYLKGEGGYGRNRIREADLNAVLKYCGMDSLLEHKLCRMQMKDLGVGNAQVP